MPDQSTLPMLEALIDIHADLDHVQARIWEAWEAGEIGSPACRQLLAKVKDRRRADAAERRRLAEEFDRVEPAAEGVEAPEETEGRDGW